MVSFLVASAILASSAAATGGYGDVAPGAYFAAAVQWSADQGITDIDDECFLPDAPVTRAEVAVSLWNMQGRPPAEPHSFIDVGEGRSRNDAISWMQRSGVTTGTSKQTFSPDAPVTRAQIAAFLHRLAGRPYALPHSFVDITSAWMHAPVSWMAAEGITTGVSPLEFAPSKVLTRAQLVTFLYRYNGQPEVVVEPSIQRCCLRVSAGSDPCGLAAELDRLVQVARDWDRTVEVAVSVILHDGSTYGQNADDWVPSASAVKPVWAAAAIDVAGLEQVAPLITDSLVHSNNLTAGRIIDLAGGVDAVNVWARDVAGMDSTYLSGWSYGSRRVSSLAQGRPRTTTGNLANFYVRLHRGELLDPAGTNRLESALKSTARTLTYVDGAILDRLPKTATADALQKMGWLPPGGNWVSRNAVIGGALVVLDDGEWFAIAISSRNSERYQRSIKWFGFVACRIYVVLSDDSAHACERRGDPPLSKT